MSGKFKMNDFIESAYQNALDLIWIPVGILLVVGSVRDWDWLCDPTGKPHAPLMTRGMLRIAFFFLGIVLSLCGIWLFVKRF